MTAAYRVFVAERTDIAKVTVVCPKCDAALSLGIETANIPEGCASCGFTFRDTVRNALTALARFHREAKQAELDTGKAMFQFEIRERGEAR